MSERELMLDRTQIPKGVNTKIANSTINARADTVGTKPAFRSAYKKRRNLIMADGYYKLLREGKEHQPFVYKVDGAKPVAMAGVWELWPGMLMASQRQSNEPLGGQGRQ